MKVVKNFFVSIAVATLVSMLSGCEGGLTSPDVSLSYAPISIYTDETSDLRSEIIRKIDISKSMSRNEHHADGNYEMNRISELTEFYLPNVEIDGYKLIAVRVYDGVLIYQYVPFEVEDYYEFSFNSGTPIDIHIRRLDLDIDVFDVETEQASKEGWGYITEDGMLYAEEHNNIVARLGNTSVRIDVPKHLNSYEFLRDLALQVISTAELVNVQYELDVLRQSEN